jgi:hypothetical protein
METLPENDTTCCYAVQDKVWVHGPGEEPWEVYTVKADSATYGTDTTPSPATCCQPDAVGDVDEANQPDGCCA